ncbi:unnamed protein product [Paramecium sonneborni]|uniref:DNA repair metallo-beta-lactamase domain-containing protein n=1 Tax=Paramecium sonneborni TaxID=65129 RepID=A0A8S1RE93_9CILI|nr:unnamed protein product [Paramecium sonneborni]
MRLITNTNIIVDDFELAKDYKLDTFIHFLTHFHQDHWQGMTPLWNYGKIYCSKITKQFILNKFPKIERIVSLDMNHIYYLNLKTQDLTDRIENEFTIEVALFSANHIPGSTMFLFRGYMGTILHTGDFRYNKSMITQNPILFPQYQSIQIDELIFDNTYCDPMFNFPTADIVAQQMIKIIENNIKKRVLIAMGALGKEVIVMEICKYFKTKIIVIEEKYNQLIASSTENMNLFTTDRKGYFIEIIKRSHREQIISQYLEEAKENFICINTDFLMQSHRDPDGINYMVPYSLHSNYQEMRTFVNAIKPAILKKLVIPYENFAEYRRKVRINPVKGFQGYLKRLKTNGESGYSTLIRECTDFTKISKNYTKWMTETKFRGLMEQLGVQLEPDRKNRKRKVDQVMPKPTIKQCIRELEKQYIYSKKPEKVESLEDISNRLKATNNNQQITKFLKKPQQIEDVECKNDEEEIYNIIQEYLHFHDNDA